MDPFQLSDEAIFDLDTIWLYLLEKEGLGRADGIVTELFQTFFKLAEIPNIGHRRPDLTGRKVLFYRLYSYLVIYEPGGSPISILAILHGKRNVARILRHRL